MLLRNKVHPWVRWGSSVWAHLYVSVSAGFLLTKPDLYVSISKFVTCRRRADERRRQSNKQRLSFVVALPSGAYSPEDFYSGSFTAPPWATRNVADDSALELSPQGLEETENTSVTGNLSQENTIRPTTVKEKEAETKTQV